MLFLCFIFFFKQKTAYEMRISDWSSDVCSSDLPFHPIPGTCRDAPHRKTDSEGQAGSLALERMITALAPIRMQSALKKLRKCPKNTSWISVADNYSDQQLR